MKDIQWLFYQSVRQHQLSHLLLVFPLRVKASLNALPGLLKSLSLGALSWVMGADANDVGAGEDQNVGHDL